MTKLKKGAGQGKWQALKLEGDFLSGDVEGLIGIEELTDYKWEKGNKKSKRKVNYLYI